ncbi:MAG: alpha-L-fucosidase [Anditalea sp.]
MAKNPVNLISDQSKDIMKKFLFSILICMGINMLLVSCEKGVSQTQVSDSDSADIFYPAATKYATILYVTQVIERKGTINQFADHLVLNGTGQLNWQKNILKKGEYEMVLNYSVFEDVASVKVSNKKDTISSPITITEGVYSEKNEWYKNNFERKLLSDKLNLTEGLNSITLEINAPNKDFETVIYSLELIPIDKKPAFREQLEKAKNDRPSMDWFSSMKYGVMFHWTSQTAPRTGAPKSYEEAVKAFDVASFVEMVEKTGAEYVVFTGNHADPHFPAPIKEWEKVHPGWTTERDLISEIADGLKNKNIKLFLYLATHIYAKFDEVDSKEFERINTILISEIGNHYKDKIAGYWFDGWYQSYKEHPEYDFEKLYNISKEGNPNRLLALNSWVYPIVTPWQDYWAGEIYTPDSPPNDRIIKSGPGKGLQYQALVVLENDWVHTKQDTQIPSPRLDARELIDFLSSSDGKGPLTINLGIYQDGTIGEEAMAFMELIKKSLANRQ